MGSHLHDDGRELLVELAEMNNELVATQRSLAHRTAELDRALEKMKRLLGVTAHDLRSPIGTMGSFAQMVLRHADERLEPMEVTVLERILALSQRTLRHVDELVDFSAMEHGIRLALTEMNLAALVADVAAVTAVAAADKQITLVVSGPEDVPITADSDKLDNVVTNLVTNAIKYSHRGGRVEVTIDDIGDHVRLTVTDDGVGIPDEDQAHIFEAFATASSRPTEGESSTGLGLAIAKHVAEEHGGTLTVESADGQGSAFALTLPRRPESRDVETAVAAAIGGSDARNAPRNGIATERVEDS